MDQSPSLLRYYQFNQMFLSIERIKAGAALTSLSRLMATIAFWKSMAKTRNFGQPLSNCGIRTRQTILATTTPPLIESHPPELKIPQILNKTPEMVRKTIIPTAQPRQKTLSVPKNPENTPKLSSRTNHNLSRIGKGVIV